IRTGLYALTISEHLVCPEQPPSRRPHVPSSINNVKEPTTNTGNTSSTPFPGPQVRRSVVTASVSRCDHRCGETPLGSPSHAVNMKIAIFLQNLKNGVFSAC
ncbi:hypothetical protein NZL82_02695, partial [Sphingomonas sanguinis]|uniref:hypothetical protein n=1 Tax=Sphingomonas sp. LC-1 TaxID=3110957 RepID=UPI0021BB041D